MVREARTYGWIDTIIAPVRGGLMFGVAASHKLNVPLITLNYSSKTGKGDDKNHSNDLPSLPTEVRTVLLVDDIVDSGRTLKEIADHYTSQGVKVITASYHYKEGALFQPNVYYWRIPEDSEFISYPYEDS